MNTASQNTYFQNITNLPMIWKENVKFKANIAKFD